MAPITLLTRIVQAISLPRVSREITQTITRKDRSSAATILLGSNTASKSSTAQVGAVRSARSPVVVMNPKSMTPQVNRAETMGLSSGAIVGIVLGSILGFLVLLVLGYKCRGNRRSAAWAAKYDAGGDEIVYGDRRYGGEGQGGIRKSCARGGGGEECELRCEYDDGDFEGVRRPDKAVVREERRGREREKRYRRIKGERDWEWNDNDNDGYDRRNRSRRWEKRGSRRRKHKNTWVVLERRGILGWGRPVRSSRGRSLRRVTEMRGECGEFGTPVRNLRGVGGDKELRFVVPN